MVSPSLVMVPAVSKAPLEGVGGGGGVAGSEPVPERGEQGLGQDAQHDVEVDVELTVEDRASAQNAWMISARRCSMVIRPYWATSALVLIWSSLVMMTGGPLAAQPVTTSWRSVPG